MGEIVFKADYEKTSQGVDLKISVKDSGIGIKEKDIEQLFHAFEQIDSKRSRSYNGTGLGLAISKELVNLMGGELRFESTYGKGSHFYFTVPQAVENEVPSVEIKEKEKIRMGIFVENEAIKKTVINTVKQLQLQYKEITDKESVKEELGKGVNFLFLECKKSSDTLEILRGLPNETRILMQEEACLKEYEQFSVDVVKLPIYSMSLAVVLNNEKNGREMYEQEINANRRRFQAPEAKILIVDDNAVNLKVAVGLLRPYGMQIDTAISGEECIQKVMDNKYDLVLMDHMMPQMDGIEATKIIRQQEEDYYKELPIIALSANAVHGAQQMFMEAGMNDFVPKPIEMRFLAGKLLKWLPKEKIADLQNENKDAGESEKIKEADLDSIEGLDKNIGLSYVADDEELYHEVLMEFADEVEKRAEEIEQFLLKGDVSDYVIRVHALKSLAKTIGAMELSEQAKELEERGTAEDMEVIYEKTPALLKDYRALGKKLQDYGNRKNNEKRVESGEVIDSQYIPIDKMQLEEKLQRLIHCLDEYDSFGAEQILEEMKQYKYESETQKEMLSKMTEAMQEFDYNACKEAAERMMG